MEAWQWVVLIALVVGVLLLASWAVARSRRRTRTLERFGPEYDRAVEQHGDRRAAEHDLVDRAKRRDQLDVRPLDEEARQRYGEQWRTIQSRFVDAPEASISEADALLDRVMHDRGYPVEEMDERADLVSVDHPDVIENYRLARSVRRTSATRTVTTDELREALLRYRSLFEELLRDERTTAGTTARDGGEERR